MTSTSITPSNTALHNIEDGVGEEEEGFALSEIVLALGIFFLMIGIGATIERQLFLKMFRNRKALKAAMVGICCQFMIMPVLTYTLAVIFRVSGCSQYATLGFVLVGCMPGGSLSNIWTVWTAGVLELSVFMTLVSTILSFGLTPFWIWLFSTQAIGLDAQNLAFDQIGMTFALLIIPLSIGWALNWKVIKPQYKNKIVACSSVLAIFIFVATIVLVGLDFPEVFSASNWQFYIPAILLFPIAVLISYAISRGIFKFEPALCRTIVMEVAMQNMALSVSIASVMIRDKSLQSESLPFPMFYVICMFGWALVLVPFCQYQKYYNTKHNIKDIDANFFGEMTEDNDDDQEVVVKATESCKSIDSHTDESKTTLDQNDKDNNTIDDDDNHSDKDNNTIDDEDNHSGDEICDNV